MKKDFALPVPIYLVDAFAPGPFQGNPAGVCFLTEPKSDEWMQQVALEMNQAETAFFQLQENGNFLLRWFTPVTEVDLCGHATLATAHVIWHTDLALSTELLRFHTRSGLLTASRQGDWIELDFPRLGNRAVEEPPGLAEALSIRLSGCWEAGDDLIVLVDSEALVNQARPKMEILESMDYRGIIVTSLAAQGSDFDFVSRFFGPKVGVPEDPATGSAHCALGPFWSERLGKTDLKGFQASRRGGLIRVILPKSEPERVKLLGKAFMMMQGFVAI